jgi:hypothetical protein
MPMMTMMTAWQMRKNQKPIDQKQESLKGMDGHRTDISL